MDRRDFAIGVLSTTAAILLVGLLLVQTAPAPVLADGMTTSSGGNYVLTVGGVTQADEEFVYVLDSAADKMIVYRFDAHQREIQVVQGVDLAEIRKASGGDAAPPKPPGRSRQP